MTEPPTALTAPKTAWSIIRKALADAFAVQVGEQEYEFYSARMDEIAREADDAIKALPPDSTDSFPSLWWCESCDAHVACEAKHGDLVCPHHHIVASFTP